MSHVHESAYPRLKPEYSEKELVELYSPTDEEAELVNAVRGPIPRLGLLLQLKLFPRLGYFPRLSTVPVEIVRYLAEQTRVRRPPTKTQLREYDGSGSKARHQKIIRERMGVEPWSDENRKWLTEVAEAASETKEMVPDIINVMLEELVHRRFELPGFSVLQRMARSARNKVNLRCFRAITQNLTDDAKARIDELLLDHPKSRSTAWHALKREPKRPTNREVRSYLEHVKWLQSLGREMPAVSIPTAKLAQFTLEARALNVKEFSELKLTKRYALAVLLIRSQHSKALDDVAELFIRLVRKIDNIAQKDLQDYILQHQEQVDALVFRFKDVLTAYQQEGKRADRLSAIEDVIAGEADELIDRCDEHLAYSGNNHIPFMPRPYRTRRALLFNCLKILDLQSTSNDRSTHRLLLLLRALRSTTRQQVTPEHLESLAGEKFGPKRFPVKWRKLIVVRTKGTNQIEGYHRKYLELWILSHIKQELSSGDLHIPQSDQFNDYREQLVDDATLSRELEEYGDIVELPLAKPSAFTKHLQKTLTETAQCVDQAFPENAHAAITDGRLVLRRQRRPVPPKQLQMVDEVLTADMADTSIVDILTDVEKWLDLHKTTLSPLSGNERKIDEPAKRFITTLFCYGCNLGPTQTARSIKGISRRQVAWLNLKHASEDRLDKAIVKVVNAYNKIDLPKYWGTGKHASADGTKWDLYEQNLMSEYHIRYGGYGGIGYYHVSDTYIALFSHFIPCGVYEAVYILDGLMSNKSDIQPDTLHGDTQAQSYPVFGLSYLLGIQLMPRIRNVHDMTLFRPDKKARYSHIDELFGANIDYSLIERHLPDMLRVAISIKLGKITASTILRRLGTYSKKNKLYFAFQELGKVVRTIFLLRYIAEINIRQTIQAATNKSEEFNNFAQWLFFGGQGVIAENIRHEQRKIIKYNHLVANMVILYNTERMTRVLLGLQEDGMELTPETLERLSPYRNAHVNRLGDYVLDLERAVQPLDFSVRIL